MMKKRKMLARLTIASAMPARLIGFRNSMRERCQGSTGGGGVFSASMFHLFGFSLLLGRDFRRFQDCARVVDRLGDRRAVQSMLVLVVVQRHFSVPPRPV